jgi:hypothetical protein
LGGDCVKPQITETVDTESADMGARLYFEYEDEYRCQICSDVAIKRYPGLHMSHEDCKSTLQASNTPTCKTLFTLRLNQMMAMGLAKNDHCLHTGITDVYVTLHPQST